MRSSYLNKDDINYQDLFELLLFQIKPKKIVEFGILDGFSLDIFSKYSSDTEAFDIFEEFNGNHAENKNLLRFQDKKKNIKISYGDFYKKVNDFENKSIDLLHIDIANNGDVYQFVIDNYLNKISDDGIIVLEGGSIERDNTEWMKKYNKTPINQTLDKLKQRIDLDVKVFGKMPSITVIKRNSEFKIRELELEDFHNGYFELINYFTRELNEDSKKKVIKNFNNLQNEYFRNFVVLYKNEIIGNLKVILEFKSHNNGAKMGIIQDFVIKKEYQNKKIGSILIKHVINFCKENGCYKIVLNCNEEVKDFYLKNNFIEKGKEMTIYLND